MSFFKKMISFFQISEHERTVKDDFIDMMNETKKMYDFVFNYVFNHGTDPEIESKLYEKDITVNKSERNIRKRLIENLSSNRKEDVNSILAMMSISKDAERLGDYCKNIFQTFRLLKGNINQKNKFYKPLKDAALNITYLIDETIKAYKKNNADIAADTIDKGFRIKISCENMIKNISKSRLSANESVVFVLITRFIKRIAAHLCNIVSSIIYPANKIDYFPKYRKNSPKKNKK